MAKAKRGDLMFYPVVRTSGRRYAVAWVTGVTRNGKVRAYQHPGEARTHTATPPQLYLVDHEQIDVARLKRELADRMSVNVFDFQTLHGVRNFVGTFFSRSYMDSVHWSRA